MSEYQRFLQDKGELLRYDYDLNENSIVMDVGGYKGEFAENIFKKFGCYVQIFEPVFKIDKFDGNKKIGINEYGLSNSTSKKMIFVDSDKTSLYNDVGRQVEAEFKDIYLEMLQIAMHDIDLIKINIEGEEYNLLERMLNTGIITRFKNIQVQFHNFIPNCEYRKNKIQMKLLKTHELVWRYDYIWESWRLK